MSRAAPLAAPVSVPLPAPRGLCSGLAPTVRRDGGRR